MSGNSNTPFLRSFSVVVVQHSTQPTLAFNLALGRNLLELRLDSCILEDFNDRSSADIVAQIQESTHNARVAPLPVLLSEWNHTSSLMD